MYWFGWIAFVALVVFVLTWACLLFEDYGGEE